MKTSELRELSLEALQGKLSELRRKQFDLRMQRATSQASNKSEAAVVKKTIARVLTLMREIELRQQAE